MLEKIQHQQTIYSWQFLFPEVEVSQFHSTVVRISEPIKKTTFQFVTDIIIPDNETPEMLFEKTIDCVYEWINLKLGPSTPKRSYFSENIEFDKFILPSLQCAAIPSEQQWCCRLVHADESSEKRPAIPGLTWTSEIALHRNGNKIHFAMRVFAIATNNVEQIIYIRPRLIIDIARQLHLVEQYPIKKDEYQKISNIEELDFLYNATKSQTRQIPIVLVAEESNECLFPLLLKTQLEVHRQSILAFAHVISLPENLREIWTQKIGNDLTIPQNGVRIYYPHLMSDEDSVVRHPYYSLEEINNWQWDYQHGTLAFALYLKDRLSEYAAIKPMEWGSCLFYPKMRDHKTKLRLTELEKETFHANYIAELEENEKHLRKEKEEKELEIDQLKKERFRLKQQLQNQDRLQQQKPEYLPIRVKIRKDAKKRLDKIDGTPRENLCNIIKKCIEKQWRDKHIDWKWNKNDKTDLTVIKPGATAERVVGYENDEIFFITHVFDSHDEYINALPNRYIEEFHNDEYVDID